MVSREEINSLKREILTQKQTIDAFVSSFPLARMVTTLEKQNKERGKSLNKLWEKGKELTKEIVRLKEFCGRLTYDVSRLHLENRIIIPSSAKLISCENKQFLVRDILRQLINESGYDLEFKVLQMRYPTKPDSIMTGKEIKK